MQSEKKGNKKLSLAVRKKNAKNQIEKTTACGEENTQQIQFVA